MAGLVGIFLLLPLLAVLVGIYQFAATQTPRSAARRRFDQGALIGSCLVTLLAIWFAVDHAPPANGPIWRHVYAALVGWFAMLLALGLAWWARRRL